MYKLIVLLITIIFTSCIPHHVRNYSEVDTNNNEIKHKTAKNIILMIGDGLGLSQISAAMYNQNNQTVFEDFKVIGLHKNHSLDNLITDSAAGATAFATGMKTYNGSISMNVDSVPIETILEQAEMRGLATGLITTCGITHATPACFIAHNNSRQNKNAIARDFLDVDIDIFIGGGKSYFEKQTKDGKSLIMELKKKSYVVEDFNELNINKIEIETQYPYVFFTSNFHPNKAIDGRDYLPKTSIKVVDYLSKRSEKGFFLMIEGSQIDWAGHDNDVNYMLEEIRDFDKTVRDVLQWAKQDGETLVIVTADHETGGFCIVGGDIEHLETAFATNNHTATLIPVFAYGPGSEHFSGIYENTEIYYKMLKSYAWNDKK